MKLKFEFEVEIDGDGFKRYYAEYPDLGKFDGLNPFQTLIREAIATWDGDGLIGGRVAARPVTPGSTAPWKKIE